MAGAGQEWPDDDSRLPDHRLTRLCCRRCRGRQTAEHRGVGSRRVLGGKTAVVDYLPPISAEGVTLFSVPRLGPARNTRDHRGRADSRESAQTAGQGGQLGQPNIAPRRPLLPQMDRQLHDAYLPPTISLLQGAGAAIRSIGEKSIAKPVRKSGAMSVPVPMSAGRSGFQSQLGRLDESDVGNGPFGLGWSVGLPTNTRMTDKRLSTYDDASESGDFILSHAKDLVPSHRLTEICAVEVDGKNESVPDEDDRDGCHIVRYRPRTEGLFAGTLDETERPNRRLLANDHRRRRRLPLRQGSPNLGYHLDSGFRGRTCEPPSGTINSSRWRLSRAADCSGALLSSSQPTRAMIPIAEFDTGLGPLHRQNTG